MEMTEMMAETAEGSEYQFTTDHVPKETFDMHV